MSVTDGDPRRGRRWADTEPRTSDLSIDEVLLLHSVGWEPTDVVFGVGITAMPTMTLVGKLGRVAILDEAWSAAMGMAVANLQADCTASAGSGVVGVTVEVTVRPSTVDVTLTGTAIRPVAAGPVVPAFVSDLSTRDFFLLRQAGYRPLGLAYGTAFVGVPYRSALSYLGQVGANVELTNLTEALYAARDRGMERMQSAALALGATGVVAVQASDRQLRLASHVVQFSAWGTAIRLDGTGHRSIRPRMVVPLDDRAVAFDPRSMRSPR